MPGSRLPGPWGTYEPYASLADGTQALIRMPSGGAVGSPLHLVALNAGHQAAQAQQQSLTIDADGMLRSPRVTSSRSLTIEHGTLTAVLGIIVHQTGGSTASSALDSYKQAGANGAHFLIDKDGTTYQTASVYKQTHHVGKLRARCLVELTCTAAEITAYKRWDPSGMHKSEMTKSVPDRYPGNGESVGIELVGRATPDANDKTKEPVYESVTAEQNASLQWLVAELSRLLAVPMTEVFRHPDVSRKNPTEARSAVWK